MGSRDIDIIGIEDYIKGRLIDIEYSLNLIEKREERPEARMYLNQYYKGRWEELKALIKYLDKEKGYNNERILI